MSDDAVRAAHTHELSPAALAEFRALLDAAFEGDFSDADWDHGLGGIHAWVTDGRGVAAHGSVIMRRASHAGRSYRVGYVEAVAVRADRRRQGLGVRVMERLHEVVDGAYDFGALSASDAGAGLYRSLGWRAWPGRIEAYGPGGVEHLADEEGTTYLRPAAGRALPDPAAALQFDWRDGDVM
ncbi:GNAT family N-acetyltransferase [Streptomyces sp. NPDC001941]|uniref:GNAT family N-acetyltransferase n=1 Tax=Streptomyces sp. NPDC001941 TaxID=3154659 RepID=UPI003327B8C5